MNVLLVYPKFPDTFWSYKHALKFIRKKAFAPPLGLLTVSAMLPSDWESRLVDLNVTQLEDADLAWADYVFVSAMTVQRSSAREIIARARESGTPIVAGGPLFTEEHASFPEIDHFVLNEAEVTLEPFLEDVQRGQAARVYASDEFPDIRSTPVPRWDLAELHSYGSVSIQYSRGCPFNCDFCNVTALFGHRPRTKTASQIVSELDALYDLGWRGSVFFVDDNLIGKRSELKREILPALIHWRQGKVGLDFSTEVTIDLADDDELMGLMTAAGFHQVFVGIETPHEESLAECSKHQNRKRDLTESVRRIQRAGMQVQGGFIVGFDSDPPSIFRRQRDFIQRSGIVAAMVGLLQAPHGTRLYERLVGEGRILGDPSGDNVSGLTNIVPKMGLEQLRSGYRWLLGQLYSPKLYYERVRNLLREYRPRRTRAHLDKEYVLALFRSIYRLGIVGRERVHYWRLFFWTLFRRPRLFPTAIALAIYGYHFRTVAEQHVC
jgi:radical SAM superfamily enzyme YgiQ (UPF0313 family)